MLIHETRIESPEINQATKIIDEIFAQASRLGITQSALAHKLNVNPSYISRLKKQKNLTLKQVEKLCKVVGCTVVYRIQPVKEEKPSENIAFHETKTA